MNDTVPSLQEINRDTMNGQIGDHSMSHYKVGLCSINNAGNLESGGSQPEDNEPLYTRGIDRSLIWNPSRAYVLAPKHAAISHNANYDVLDGMIMEQKVQEVVDYNEVVVRDRSYRLPEWSVPGLACPVVPSPLTVTSEYKTIISEKILVRAAQVRQAVSLQIAEDRARQKIQEAARRKRRMERLAYAKAAAERKAAAAIKKKSYKNVNSSTTPSTVTLPPVKRARKSNGW